MKVIKLKDWKAEAEKRFGKDNKQWKFVCPSCKQVQTWQDFIDNNVNKSEEKFYFSCLGRWVEGRGCDWTLGGLFRIHKTEVEMPSGDKIPVMEFSKCN